MKILCPTVVNPGHTVPAVGLCCCGSAVELDRVVTPCPGCELEYTKEGRELPPKFNNLDDDA